MKVPMQVPIQLWQLLVPLEHVERQQVVDAVVKVMPVEMQEVERGHLLSGLPARPRRVDGRPGSARLVELDGITIYHSYVDSARITLFELAAPAVPGCRVTLERTTSRRASAQWSIGLQGASARRRTEVRTTLRAAFSVEPGQRKRVFVDVPAEIERVFEIKDSTLRPTDLVSVTAPRKRPTTIPVPGVELVEGEYVSRGSTWLAPFPLAGDPTGAVSTYSYEYEYSREVTPALRASVKGFDVGATASVGVTAGLKLTFALVGGHDYQLHATHDGLGITWTVT
jgi:hypothetical protein